MKYRNSSEFRQAIVVGGKRVLMLPGDVVESSKELTVVWLEQVSDDTKVTVTPSRRVSSIKTQVEQIKTANKDAVVAGKEELENLTKSIKESAEEAISESVGPLASELDKTQKDLAAITEEYEKFKETVMRRMDIMKSAMMTLQQDFYEIEFDEEGRVVQDDTKSE